MKIGFCPSKTNDLSLLIVRSEDNSSYFPSISSFDRNNLVHAPRIQRVVIGLHTLQHKPLDRNLKRRDKEQQKKYLRKKFLDERNSKRRNLIIK